MNEEQRPLRGRITLASPASLRHEYFNYLPSAIHLAFQTYYPKLARFFFQIAEKIIHGSYGEDLQIKAFSLSEDLFQQNVISSLATEEKIDLKQDEIKSIQRSFRHFVHNWAHPSHLLIDLYINLGKGMPREREQKALELTYTLKNPIEISRSLFIITRELITHHQTIQALHIIEKNHQAVEMTKPLFTLINKLAAQGGISDLYLRHIFQIIRQFSHPNDRKNLLHFLIRTLAEKNQLPEAIEMSQYFPEREEYDYTLCSLVQTLAHQHQIPLAIDLTLAITDSAYQEDAYSYILKQMIHQQNKKEAQELIEAIPSVTMQRNLEKFL